ncbi:DUF814 domain-containing protein [Candidatus Woesearchaeota archaeon]|nr:DUF814 domain-containing protein [Candidatus Woesearchaeota archaeon]
MRLILDIRKTVEQNAAAYFERAKKFKAKSKGAREAIARFSKELAKQVKEAPKIVAKQDDIAKHWYDKFRWFLSSEGYLCVGGRDATSNEVVLKKHTEAHDVVCHTEAPGSPFFIIKTEGTKPKDITIDEALQATASYSKAWKLGVSTADAYTVEPSQISKEAQAGEFLAKGSFMVRGKRNVKRVPIKLAIGLLPDGRVMGGPESAIKQHCTKRMLIQQGTDKPSDAAKKIQKYLGGGHVDDIIRCLPAGELKVVGL